MTNTTRAAVTAMLGRFVIPTATCALTIIKGGTWFEGLALMALFIIAWDTGRIANG